MENWDATRRDFTNYLLSSGRAEKTAYVYTRSLSVFWRWCARYETSPADVDREAIRSWVAERLEIVSGSRVHNDLAALRHFYAFLKDCRVRDDDPTENLKVKRSRSLPTAPLSADDLDKLLGVCGLERDRLIVLTLAGTGLRVSELASLKAEAIDWQRGLIKVRGKGDKERLIAPPPELLARLHAFVGMFPAGALFVSKWGRPLADHQIRKLLYDIADRAKVGHVHPHRFRATFATMYLDQFADIEALQGLLGHRSIETTARYTEYTRERRGLEQMRKFSLGKGLTA